MVISRFLNVFILSLFLCYCFVCPLSAEATTEVHELLSQIQRDSFQYFLRMSDKKTGLTKDSTQPGAPASIAATGFSLASFAIAYEKNWVEHDYAYAYLTKTLKTLVSQAEHKNGFFYHFLDARTGRRAWDSEASSIDTALLIAGALVAASFFPDSPIEKMTETIYHRVNWRWMMNETSLVCMGWKPESSFLPYYWDSYNELIILQALEL